MPRGNVDTSISDKPMTEEQWTKERATQIFSYPQARRPITPSEKLGFTVNITESGGERTGIGPRTLFCVSADY
jgi:hypothetical protein